MHVKACGRNEGEQNDSPEDGRQEKRNLDVWALHNVIPQQKNAKYNHLNLCVL